MMAYIVGLDMSAFVYDYDYNAPDAAHLAATHYAGYRAVRAAHPELPIVMASRPNFDYSREDGGARRDIIAASYERAVAEGDTHVYFVDGAREYRTFVADGCTVDGCHPNDLGIFAWRRRSVRSWKRFSGSLERVLTGKYFQCAIQRLAYRKIVSSSLASDDAGKMTRAVLMRRKEKKWLGKFYLRRWRIHGMRRLRRFRKSFRVCLRNPVLQKKSRGKTVAVKMHVGSGVTIRPSRLCLL